MGKKRRTETVAAFRSHRGARAAPVEKFSGERIPPALLAMNERQDAYLEALRNDYQIVALGPAGTGKTYIAATFAADQLRAARIRRIVLVRPNVPSGRPLGFYPGTPQEKLEPWLKPILDALRKRMGEGAYETARKNGGIEIVAFETMRGDTFEDCIVILDEAQNTTPHEMKMFLTRIGRNCTVVVNGDVSQSDIKMTSGLATMMRLVGEFKLDVRVIEFGLDDIVRSGLCEMWVRSFHEAGL